MACLTINLIFKFIFVIILFVYCQYIINLGINNLNKDVFIDDDNNAKAMFLDNYNKIVYRDKYNPKCSKVLAFGFCSDIDIVIDAEVLVSKLKPYYSFSKYKNVKRIPKKINNFGDLERVLKYYISKSAGTEKFVHNKELFDILKKVTLENIKIKDLGGNATMMAERSYKENCKSTILGANMSEYYDKLIYKNNISYVEKPKENINDYHIVIDYYKGQNILGIDVKRSNRLYLNHDIDNANMKYFFKLMNYIENMEVDFVLISCFQLLDLNNLSKNKRLLNKLIQTIKKNKTKKIHLELASINNKYVLKKIIENVIPISDSMGVNEQELVMVWNYLNNKKMIKNNINEDNIFIKINNFFKYNVLKYNYDVKSSYDINTLIRIITDIVDTISYYKYKTNRIHMHSINSHIICHKKDIYNSTKFSITKAILTSLKVASEEEFEDFNYFKNRLNEFVIRIPNKIKIITSNGYYYIDKKEIFENPNYCWSYSSDWKCCIGLTIELIKPKRVRGLGDNISSAGIIYQGIKSN